MASVAASPNVPLIMPPPLTPADTLLASRISLPGSPRVAVATYRPATSPQDTLSAAHDVIELARRHVLSRNTSPVLFDNVFPSPRCGKDPILYLFLLATQDSASDALHRLSDLQLEHLDPITQSVFSIQDLASSEHSQTHAHFLEAVRSFILSDLSEATVESPGYASPKRLGDGFILERKLASSDWASSWDQSANTRPIVHFRLQVQISFTNNAPSHFIVHAIPVPTPYSTLPSSANPGLPIILMPYGTPAYFLSVCSGPSHSLIKQFRDSLKGLGTGAWEGPSQSTRSLDSDRTSFIIGWIRVENRQGEDKGTLFVWPSRLCLSYSDTFTHRQPLGYIPEMPAPLQASPQLPAQEGVASDEVGDDSRFPDTAEPFQSEPSRTPPHPEPLRAFQSFTVSKSKDIRSLANEVGGYVDSVVRERERERERLKKERELAGANTSPKMSRNVVQPAAASASTRAQPQLPSTPQISNPTTSLHSTIPHVQHAEAFYPSPPQSGQTPHAPPPDNTSPEMEVVSLPSTSADPTYQSQTDGTAPPRPSGSTELSRKNSYDSLFGDSGPTWGQSSSENSYMDMGMGMDFSMNVNMEMNMNMDMDLDFNMEMPTSRTTSANPFGTTNRNGAPAFEDAFTDDDFSFFDQPSKSNPPPPPVSVSTNAVPLGTSLHAQSTPMDVDPSRPFHLPLHNQQPSLDQTPGASGPGPPLSGGVSAMPWTPATQDGATPGGPRLESVPPALDLVPFTPDGVSPDLHQYQPSPETPTVQLTFAHGHGANATSKPESPMTQRANHSSILFDPIPFSTSHKDSDEKYSYGKFAFLPSPSPEPGYDPAPPPPRPPWRTRYNSLTDPRIGVFKQLVCVKQKASASSSPPKPYPHETDWMDIGANAYHTPPDDKAMDVSSDSDDSDEEDGLSTTSGPSNTSPLQSRPCTPPPSYLPPGPSLLHLRFTHAPLLPLSTPLRSPGAVSLHQQFGPHSTTGHGSTPFASVPTPVSPAAALGAASEQSKNLESMAHAIAVEFVENSLWAEVWRVNNQRGSYGRADEGSRKATVWPDDLKAAAEVMRKIGAAKQDGEEQGEVLCKVGSLFSLDPSAKLVPYDPPSISIGKGDAIIQLLPPALRFWQKLGLGPKGGRKDVEVYVFYEDVDDQKRAVVDGWLTAASNAYGTKHMGQFIRGCTNPANDALLPIRFDASFRQTFNLFIANIIKAGPPIAIIIFVPVTSMTFTSPSLRSVLSGINKRLKDFDGRQITFHFIPDPYLIDLDHSPRGYNILDELCMVMYNRIQVEVERNLSRRMLPPRRLANSTRFQEPTFTLARPLNSKVALVRSAHTSLDVVDRFTFLHVGYRISPCRKWVFACCVDQRGEEYDLGLWLVSPPEPGDGEGEPAEIGDGERDNACEQFAVDKVWSLALEVARRVDVEWRVVVAKLGLMSSTEIEAWTELYAKDAMARPKSSTPLHLILASANHSSPFTLVPKLSSITSTSSASSTISPSRAPTKGMATNTKAVSQLSDASATYYAIFPTSQLSVAIPLKLDIYSTSFVSEPTLTPPSPHHGREGIMVGDHLDIPTTSPPDPPTVANSPSFTVSSNQEDSTSLPQPIPFIPLSSSTLIRVPSLAPISMLHIYIVKVLHPVDSLVPHSTSLTAPDPPPPSVQDELTRELTRNFYELSILSSARFHLDRCETVGVDPVLPLHLSAVEAMRFSIDCDWDEEGCGSDGGS